MPMGCREKGIWSFILLSALYELSSLKSDEKDKMCSDDIKITTNDAHLASTCLHISDCISSINEITISFSKKWKKRALMSFSSIRLYSLWFREHLRQQNNITCGSITFILSTCPEVLKSSNPISHKGNSKLHIVSLLSVYWWICWWARLYTMLQWWCDKRNLFKMMIFTLSSELTSETLWKGCEYFSPVKKFKLPFEINLDFKMGKNCSLKSRLTSKYARNPIFYWLNNIEFCKC